MSNAPDKTKIEEIFAKIYQYKKDIQTLLLEIKDTSDVERQRDLYMKIINIDNTNETYVVNYLLCQKKLGRINKISNEKYINEVKKYSICISDAQYNEHFKEIERENSKQKILSFIKLIKDCSIKTDEEKMALIGFLFIIIIKINSIEFNNKKKVTWDNKELYLYCLYEFLIYSVTHLLIYYNKIELSPKILDNEEYKKICNELDKEILKQNNEIKINSLKIRKITFLLNHAQFFGYIKNMKAFLNAVDKNFNIRFKNLELDNNDDQILFEDYIHFLATYKFDKCDYISLWNSTFVPLSLENKKKIINVEHQIIYELSEDGKKLRLFDGDKDDILEADKYDLENLIYYSKEESDINSIKWKINKYIKPIYYKEELFVCKTKEYWKKLLIDIFQSKAYTEVRNSLLNQSQIDFFMVDNIISEIIDNIKFFIYSTMFFGNTNKMTNTIYEYGNYNIEIKNKSIALLIFYGFHIIINIHEIGGHLNIRYQYFIFLKDEFCSPKIDRDSKENYYTKFANERGKESGETIEIELFGKVKSGLTIKEALFILNKDNYELSAKEFKEKFLECNSKSFDSLINENLRTFLLKLEINPDDLDEDDKYMYNYPINRKTNETVVYTENKSRHPISFYYDNPEFIKDFIKNYCNINDYQK